MNKFEIKINEDKTLNLEEFINSYLPEHIYSLKLDFTVNKDSDIDLVSLIIVLSTLLSKVKNSTEYVLLLQSLCDNMMLIKKLEHEAGLSEYRY